MRLKSRMRLHDNPQEEQIQGHKPLSNTTWLHIGTLSDDSARKPRCMHAQGTRNKHMSTVHTVDVQGSTWYPRRWLLHFTRNKSCTSGSFQTLDLISSSPLVLLITD